MSVDSNTVTTIIVTGQHRLLSVYRGCVCSRRFVLTASHYILMSPHRAVIRVQFIERQLVENVHDISLAGLMNEIFQTS